MMGSDDKQCITLQTGQLTPWSRILLEKLIAVQLFKIFSAIYGTGRSITVFTTAHNRTLS
jgi:hypothetical protein